MVELADLVVEEPLHGISVEGGVCGRADVGVVHVSSYDNAKLLVALPGGTTIQAQLMYCSSSSYYVAAGE